MAWDPVAEPYRICSIIATTAPGLFGWRAITQTFADEASARVILDQPLLPLEKKRTLDIAINPETWLRNGRFQTLATLNRKAKRT